MACIPRMFICQFLMNHYFNNQSAGCINSSLIRHLHLVAHSVVRHREGVLMPTLLQKFQLEGFLEQGVLLQGLELPFQLWTLLFHQLHLSLKLIHATSVSAGMSQSTSRRRHSQQAE